MLIELKITNLALISGLDIEFDEGLTVMTGETGAGKSIVLQAVNLLYGQKAARGWVRNGSASATVEALFTCNENSLVPELLEKSGFGRCEEVILKRVISSKGSSRYYINSSLATGKVVGQIAENLVSIASQHDHQQLLSPTFQLDFIDLIGGLSGLRKKMSSSYGAWAEINQELKGLEKMEQDKEQRRDFLRFQCNEILAAEIVPGEDEELDNRKKRLRSFEELKKLGVKSYELLSRRINDQLAEVRHDLTRMVEYDQDISELADAMTENSFQIEELTHTLRNYIDSMVEDPRELDEVTARIDLLQGLKRKYGPTLQDVVAFCRNAENELQQITDLDDRILSLTDRRRSAENKMLACCRQLAKARRVEAEKLGTAITSELHDLCIENAAFKICFTGSDEPGISEVTSCGWDTVEFTFSANPGEPLKPVAKVASGGELSRLMLALKSILASRDQVDTVIFDEVDAGISGKTAESVAKKIRSLADHHQVLCITHLPQIASGANQHYTVRKTVADGRTHTSIVVLNENDRVNELARMLDGDSVTENTLIYARELVGRKK